MVYGTASSCNKLHYTRIHLSTALASATIKEPVMKAMMKTFKLMEVR